MEKVSLSLILVSYSVTYNFFFASIIIYNVNDIMIHDIDVNNVMLTSLQCGHCVTT